MSGNCALIIDDEPDIRELLEITLRRMGIDCACAPDLKTARNMLKQEKFNLCLTDMRLPDGDGLDFVEYIQTKYPDIPVAVITAHGNIETAIQALKSGAFDFVTKPVDLASLRLLVQDALKLTVTGPRSAVKRELIGQSRIITELRETIAKLSRNQAPVYISGESGVGKEMVARMIHERGPRSARPFVPVNCGAIPSDLLESELFGHKKGSFTGADSDKEGLFQAADGGTLFLDEIAELPQHMQVKLLRVIQEKRVRPIGAQTELPVNVRILSATHKDLAELVRKDRFRQDLFYRINVIELTVPPLRDRKEDIPLLVAGILRRIASEYAVEMPEVTAGMLEKLIDYDYPGNVRELENILERAMALSEGGILTIPELNRPEAVTSNPAQSGDGAGMELETYLSDVEKKVILEALEKSRWNKTAAAKMLGISFRALRYRLEKLGMN
jgi:two-component system response regulator PilR (NtrC family)